jgi:hypothetical protein
LHSLFSPGPPCSGPGCGLNTSYPVDWSPSCGGNLALKNDRSLGAGSRDAFSVPSAENTRSSLATTRRNVQTTRLNPMFCTPDSQSKKTAQFSFAMAPM